VTEATVVDVAAEPAARPTSPYKGLRPFTQEDAAFFFGRDSERRLIRANMMSARLTLLYGASGVGKSSVLLAGVVPDLLERARKNTAAGNPPGLVPVVFGRWKDDPVGELARAIREAAAEVLGENVEAATPPVTLDAEIERVAERVGGPVLIVLDQFEEYFLYHGDEDGEDTFAVQFPRVVNRKDLRVGLLVAIREDAIAKLDRFKGRIPQLFENYLRIEHLDPASARDAITRPVEEWNRLVREPEQMSIEDALVDAVLAEVRPEQIAWEQTGAEQARERAGSDRIDTSFLQLVLERLWRAETGAGSRTLRESTLRELGGAKGIVREHVEEGMPGAEQEAERAIATAIFQFLVTQSGSKVAHTAADLAGFADESPEAVERVLDALASGDVRILKTVAPPPDRPDKNYELYHDLLAEPVLAWRARQVEEAHERRARRKARRYAAIALVMLAVAAVCGVLAYLAVAAKHAARAQSLVAQSVSALGVNPARSVVLADRASKAHPSPEADAALRTALTSSPLRLLIRHRGEVYRAKYAAHGARIFTAAADGTARVSNTKNGAAIRTFDHADAADISADGKRVAIGSGNSIRLMNVETDRPIGAPWHDPDFGDVVINPAGTEVVSVHAGGLVRVWTAGQRAPIALRVKTPEVWGAAFDPTGTRVLVWGKAKTAWILTPRTRRIVPLVGHTNWILVGAFSDDGHKAVTGGMDRRAIVWDSQTGERLAQVPESNIVDAVAFAPGGGRFATAGGKWTHVWETGAAAPKRVAELRGHTDWVIGVAFRPKDGEVLATASRDGTARVFDVDSQATLMDLRGHANILDSVAFSPDGASVLTASADQTARTWNVATGVELREHTGWVLDAEFNLKGDQILSVGEDHRLVLWDPRHGTAYGALPNAAKREVNAVRFSADGTKLVLASNDNSADVRGTKTGNLISTISAYYFRDDVVGVDFDPTGKLVVAASSDGWAGIFRSKDGDLVRWLHKDKKVAGGAAHDEALTGVDWSPNGQYIVTTGTDDVARVWNPKTGLSVGEFTRHVGDVYSPSFSSDGRFVVTGGDDRSARVWNVATQRQVARLPLHAAPVRATAFNPKRPAWVVTGSADGVVRVWNWRTQQLLAVLRKHADYINSVSFSPDGKRILSASDDWTAKIYACDTCESIDESLRQRIKLYERYFPR
jgi:WD40 repeat protein